MATFRGRRASGYMSGLEEKVAAQLAAAGAEAEYEMTRLGFTPPLKSRSYTPDWILSNGIIIEAKGRLDSADRVKHKHIKKEHPALDIRFVFSRSKQKINKGSKTSYADWCYRYGFEFADMIVPLTWIDAPRQEARYQAILVARV